VDVLITITSEIVALPFRIRGNLRAPDGSVEFQIGEDGVLAFFGTCLYSKKILPGTVATISDSV